MEFVNPIRKKSQIDEIKRLMLGDEKWRDYLLFVFGINSGLRISDILQLKYSDLIENSKIKAEISLREKKTGKSKILPLNDSIRNAIQEVLNHLRVKPACQEYLFHGKRTKTPLSRVYCWKVLNKYARKVGITESIGTHSMRKSLAWHLYKKGVQLPTIMKMMNHGSQAVTMRYIGINQQEINEVYSGLNL